MDDQINVNTINIAYLNIHGQSGLNISKQKQIEDFIIKHDIDILNCQEINIVDDSFAQCAVISSKYNILQNNALNKYGTAVLLKNEYDVENVKVDTVGRAIVYDIQDITFGNIYLPSGTDGDSRGQREQFISEDLPNTLLTEKI